MIKKGKIHVYNILLFLKKYYSYIISTALILVASFGISLYNNIDTHFKYLNYLINDNIKEYNEIDLPHICALTNCKCIYLKNNKKNYYSLFRKEKTLIFKRYAVLNDIYNITDNIKLQGTNLLIFNKKANAYINLRYKDKVQELFDSFIILFFMILITVFALLFAAFKREQKEALIKTIGNEAILANKSMVVITENVHHELNTPIEVIDNKITKIHNTINTYLEEEYLIATRRGEDASVVKQRKSAKKIIKLEKDFDFIKTSIEQIFAVLNKMKNFKSLRYSNGNKTLYDIIDGAFRILAISNTNFDYLIDINFKKYKMNSNILKNVDLLNVLINHIKNSLEANANFIEVLPIFNRNTSELEIKIKDNGSGIPENILKYIFEPNFSTKEIGDSVRGNGMYLNRYIIQQAGGNISIRNRKTERGTVVIIKIKVQEITRNK